MKLSKFSNSQLVRLFRIARGLSGRPGAPELLVLIKLEAFDRTLRAL